MLHRCLFGGALFAAGISATAGAQSFQITGGFPANNFVGAQHGGARPFDIGADFWDESESAGTAFAHSFANPTTLANYADSGDTGLAYAIHFLPVYFEVTADTTATMSWDFTGDLDGIGGAYIDSFFQIYDSNGVFSLVDLNNPVGSAELSFISGERYFFIGQALASGGTGQASHWSVVIPAPGAAATLAVGALVLGSRRRRTA